MKAKTLKKTISVIATSIVLYSALFVGNVAAAGAPYHIPEDTGFVEDALTQTITIITVIGYLIGISLLATSETIKSKLK
jgi:hypothetical protein